MRKYRKGIILWGAALMALHSPAMAAPPSPLLGLSMSDLKGALDQRYQTALTATADPVVRHSTDGRYIWATEAKNQCGIAIGFTKSGTKDEESINKCDAFAARLVPGAPEPMAPPPAAACAISSAVLVFFDWDQSVVTPEGQNLVQQVIDSKAACGWTRFDVTGHTDTSGSDVYNNGLSMRRANAIAAMMSAGGIDPSTMNISGKGKTQLRVETADGVREPQNRRVEIMPSAGQ